jgi:hypothetical protein
VARELLAPAREEYLLAARHGVSVRREAREPGRDDASVRGRAGRRRAGVVPDGCRLPRRRIVGVEDVDVGRRREVRIEREPEKPAVPVVVHLRAQIGEGRGCRVVEAVEDLDDAALLGGEDAAVACEAEGGREREPTDRNRLLEALGQSRCSARHRLRPRSEKGRAPVRRLRPEARGQQRRCHEDCEADKAHEATAQGLRRPETHPVCVLAGNPMHPY